MPSINESPRAVSAVVRSILSHEGAELTARQDSVAAEEPLEIQLSYEKRGSIRVTKNISVTMRTPGFDEELAAGFLFTEGILSSRYQSMKLRRWLRTGRTDHGNSLRVTLRSGVEVDVRSLERHFYTTSSCGVCGKTSLEALCTTGQIALPPDEPLVAPDVITSLPQTLRRTQTVFDQTGGLHAPRCLIRRAHCFGARRHRPAQCRRQADRSRVSHGRVLVGADANRCWHEPAVFESIQKLVPAGLREWRPPARVR